MFNNGLYFQRTTANKGGVIYSGETLSLGYSHRGAFKALASNFFYTIGHNNDYLRKMQFSSLGVLSTTVNQTYISINQETENNPRGMYFRNNGLMFFVVGGVTGKVFRFDLSTAFDLTTVTYINSYSLGAIGAQDVYFSDDGLKMFIKSNNTNTRLYTLSTSWDITTSTLSNTYTTFGDSGCGTITFSPDGLKVFMLSVNGNKPLYTYKLINPFDLSVVASSSFFNSLPNLNITALQPKIIFSNNGLRMHILGFNDETFSFTLQKQYTADFLIIA